LSLLNKLVLAIHPICLEHYYSKEPPAEGGGPRPRGRSLGFLKKPRAPFFKKEPRLLKKAWAPRRSRGAWAPGGGPGPFFFKRKRSLGFF